MTLVPIEAIIADSRCQSRTGINLALVQEYADAIREGAVLPPLSTIRADEGYYLYDGFHRLEAYRQVGTKDVAVESEPGDVWDAIEASCAVNATHGKRRTNEDKHRAVETMIKVMDHRGEMWSANEIANRCAVSHTLVTNNTAYLSLNERCDTPTTVTRNGTTYEMNTSNIGKYRAPDLDPGPDVDDWDDDEEPEEVPYEIVDRSTGEIIPPMSRNHSMSFAPVAPVVEDTPEARARRVAQAITEEYGREQAVRIADAILSQGRGAA